MSLKRIELQGFKSFREKTIINFDHGYTCIVGPNGCGKSNVSDAIRWVLGEQSAKQLRGENMKGVIFSGTPKLPEMGYAEVTLVFDNSDHMFRTTYEEIAITRKIFRSKSDNYYYINHKPCLRKEIIELMRDTGAGKDSLNVIEQGAVTEIMKVKPEDRRHIFDEAAGIAQVKEEKKQNLKMLANTDQGIATLSARIEEMDKALAPLKRQVEVYEKFVVLRNELRDLEYNMFIYKYENADSEKDALRQHIKELEEYLVDQNRNLEESKAKIEKLTEEETQNDAKLRASLDQKETLKINRERASGDQREHKAKLDSMLQALANLTEALEQNKLIKQESEVDLAEATKVLNAKREERLNLQVESDVVSANLDEVTMELAMSESDFEKSTEERFANMSKLGEVYASQAKGEAECDILRENISRYESEIATCREQIDQKQKQIDQGKKQQLILSAKNDTIEQERKARITQINEARYTLSDLVNKIRTQEPVIQNKEINVQSLKNIIRDKKGYTKAVNYIVQAAKTNHEVARHYVG
ncbi:MAG: AAA family ATPase, partial [Clostridia bacterium]|nr:AAA family ATPase [Clostridia bacterium]